MKKIHTHIGTVLRWILTGLKSPAGELVRLEGIRIGGKWLTSKEAMQRFAERLTPDLNSRQIGTITTHTTAEAESGGEGGSRTTGSGVLRAMKKRGQSLSTCNRPR